MKLTIEPLTAFLLLLVAPVFQIIFLTLKISGRIKIPPGIIAVLAFILGIALSIASMYLVDWDIHPNPSGPRCGVIPGAFLFAGVFIITVTTPVIELIFFAIKWFKRRDSVMIDETL
jgi:hypothetical protein